MEMIEGRRERWREEEEQGRKGRRDFKGRAGWTSMQAIKIYNWGEAS